MVFESESFVQVEIAAFIFRQGQATKTSGWFEIQTYAYFSLSPPSQQQSPAGFFTCTFFSVGESQPKPSFFPLPTGLYYNINVIPTTINL